MVNGSVFTSTFAIELDYLAPADTVLTFLNVNGLFQEGVTDNLTLTIVDISGRNSVRKLVGIALGRQVI